MKYEPVIGLEVHVELNTKTKMFCRCNADYFGKKPNTHTCPVCLGLPGALPVINKQAIEDCIKIGLALNCSINPISYFERKNYFYPDLAKGFQISQLVLPVAISGSIKVTDRQGKESVIRINRAHQEEDTGKLTHQGGETLIDFNRSGVPLVEIVTEPDFKDSEQVRDYAKKLQQIFRYLGVSNADMEKGDMRLEANISVRKVGQKTLPPYRVELKNINSFRFMVAAVEYEIKRQIQALENGQKLIQETRGWNESKKETFTQRVKEEANDYRYFPEPDLPELEFDPQETLKIKESLPELPQGKIERWFKDYQVPKNIGVILTETKLLADYFDQALIEGEKEGITPKQIANYLANKKVDIEKVPPTQIVEEIKIKQSDLVADSETIEKIINEVVDENPKLVSDYKSGKLNVLQALMGQVMRKSSGKAQPQKARQILEKLLS